MLTFTLHSQSVHFSNPLERWPFQIPVSRELLKRNPANYRQLVSFLYRIGLTSVFTEGNSCEGEGLCATQPTFLVESEREVESAQDSLLLETKNAMKFCEAD